MQILVFKGWENVWAKGRDYIGDEFRKFWKCIHYYPKSSALKQFYTLRRAQGYTLSLLYVRRQRIDCQDALSFMLASLRTAWASFAVRFLSSQIGNRIFHSDKGLNPKTDSECILILLAKKSHRHNSLARRDMAEFGRQKFKTKTGELGSF